MLRNDPAHFGLVSRLIHWAMAVLIVSLLILGTRLHTMQPGLANLWLYGLHKTMGLTALALVLIRLIWHRISPPPAPLGPPLAWETRLAKAVHRLTYALLVLIPLAGWAYASATGLDVLFADRWVIPPIAPVSEAWENATHLAHSVLTKLLMAVLTLHVLGALRRTFAGDGTLTRMLRG
ncbi:MAG: cytochrome b [Cypionkella sp.]